MTAEEVDPLQLMVNVRPVDVAALRGRVRAPDTVEADVMEVSIDQIIEMEGRREPDVGFNAKSIRQAWIYVYQNPTGSSASELVRIQDMADQWSDYFNQATGGRSVMSTTLY